MEKGLSIIGVTYNHSIWQVQNFITSYLMQTSKDWDLYVVHDGPNPEVRSWVEPYCQADPRIHYRESPERKQQWGHPNRKWIFETEPMREFVTFSNIDNQVFPVYVEYMLGRARIDKADLVLNTIVHNYPNVEGTGLPGYNPLVGKPGLNRADFLNFIIRTELLRKVGINHTHFTGCDGMIIQETMNWFPETRVAHCPHFLACHN